MADFRTHLYGGVLASGAAALALHWLDPGGTGRTVALFALGVAGSLLPDIDAGGSAPVRLTFGALGALLAFAWTLPLAGHWSPLGLGVAWCALFLAVRYLLLLLFARLTVHRGIWHSWLAAAVAALAAVHLTHGLLDWPARPAWLGGAMVGLGYLVHLALDELSSLDLEGRRLRRSFGTALKPWSPTDPASSLAMAAALGLLLWLAPAPPWPAEADRMADSARQTLAQLAQRSRIALSGLRHWGQGWVQDLAED